MGDSRVSGFALIFVIIIRTTSVYCIYSETKSSKFIFNLFQRMFVSVWNKMQPIHKREVIDPNYRWYHKQSTVKNASSDVNTSVGVMHEKMNSIKSTEALSSAEKITTKEEVEIVIGM